MTAVSFLMIIIYIFVIFPTDIGTFGHAKLCSVADGFEAVGRKQALSQADVAYRATLVSLIPRDMEGPLSIAIEPP